MKIINKIIILLIIFLISCFYIEKENSNYQEKLVKQNIANYINDTSTINTLKIKKETQDTLEYNAILEIPKIKLKKGIYEKENKNNNVNKNIELINPNKINNPQTETIIIAGHSGSSKISFFHNLDILTLNDSIYLYYNGNKYEYKVIQKYEEAKVGKLSVDNETELLYLTTCSEKNKDKQLVIKTKLFNISTY